MTTAQHTPDAEFTPCVSFGGGWLLPVTDVGWSFAARHLEVERGDTPPHPCGFVVEPWQVRELAEWATVEGLALVMDRSSNP